MIGYMKLYNVNTLLLTEKQINFGKRSESLIYKLEQLGKTENIC